MLRRCLLLALPIWSCLAPTEIIVDISTDAKCSDLQGVAIAIGDPAHIDEVSPVTVTSLCSADGTIGKVVLIPSSLDGNVGIRVVGGFKKLATDCNTPYGDGCIVARRALRYVPHTPLYLPIRLNVSCAGVPCDTTSTCSNGSCVPSKIDDPTQCQSADAGCAPDGGTNAPLAFDPECGDMSGLGAGASWPMTQVCPTHIGRTPYLGPASQPSIAWKFPAGSTSQLSVPVVSSDRTVYFGAPNGVAVALDLTTSTKKWSTSANGTLSSNGALAADGTFVVGGNADLAAFDTVTHAKRWGTGNTSHDVTIGAGEILYEAAKSTLHAYDVSSGNELWNATLAAGPNAIFTSPAISADGKSLYLSADDGYFTIVDLATHTVSPPTTVGTGGLPIAMPWGYIVATFGTHYAYDTQQKLLFYVPTTTNACAAIAKDGTIVSTQANLIVGVQPPPSSGGIVWKAPIPGSVTSCLVIDGNGIVYGITSTSIVVAVDPASPATPRWTLQVPLARDLMLARDNTILVVTDLGEVIALR